MRIGTVEVHLDDDGRWVDQNGDYLKNDKTIHDEVAMMVERIQTSLEDRAAGFEAGCDIGVAKAVDRIVDRECRMIQESYLNELDRVIAALLRGDRVIHLIRAARNRIRFEVDGNVQKMDKQEIG